ncbi:hypothetical protein, partial [uncultured Escherichia sp.]|uniref:hypothetical protein n=1 Tax=uncultured Escherichia sp. TaxID=237777 RepID=UPI00266F77A0
KCFIKKTHKKPQEKRASLYGFLVGWQAAAQRFSQYSSSLRNATGSWLVIALPFTPVKDTLLPSRESLYA